MRHARYALLVLALAANLACATQAGSKSDPDSIRALWHALRQARSDGDDRGYFRMVAPESQPQCFRTQAFFLAMTVSRGYTPRGEIDPLLAAREIEGIMKRNGMTLAEHPDSMKVEAVLGALGDVKVSDRNESLYTDLQGWMRGHEVSGPSVPAYMEGELRNIKVSQNSATARVAPPGGPDEYAMKVQFKRQAGRWLFVEPDSR